MLRHFAWTGLALVALAAAPGDDIPPDVRTVLASHLRFSSDDLAELQSGKVVKHGLSTNAPGEIAVVGGVRIAADKERFLERVRDIARFKQGPEVVEIGTFSSPPVFEDLARLTVSEEDFDGRGCRVRDCSVRLPATAIERIQRDVDWTAPDAQARAAELFKHILFDNVRAYLAGSPDRIAQYDDDKRRIRPVDEFDGLLKNSPSLGRLVPGLPAHLEYPPHPDNAPLGGVEDFLYWSKEKFGLTPFITITHVTIARTESRSLVITSKDVYSSRYFDTSLGTTIAADAAAGGAFYLVYMNRSRASALKGAFSGLRRAIVERRARGGLEEQLRDVKRRLEAGTD